MSVASLARAARRSRDAIAARVAQDIPDGAHVNLGIGLPILVAEHLPADREIVLHSENGLLGMGPIAAAAAVDRDLINAAKDPVTLLAGGSFTDHAQSFAIIRGGHLDICILGAFQVSARGDLANWHTGDPRAIPSIGGAMDLAVGASRVFVMMELCTKSGESKLVPACTYPLTAPRCVSRIYTDLAVFDIQPGGVQVSDLVEGITLDDLRRICDVPLELAKSEAAA